MEMITLANGVQMPTIGFGTFMIKQNCEQHVLDALKQGYRLIDTAASYFNEEAVGRAIRQSDIPREELFVTSKLWVQDAGYDSTIKAFQTSLKALGLDYLDLYLIHQPYGDYYGSWRVMEKLMKDGYIRAIGVSNFSAERVVDLALCTDTVPMVDQIELHPFFAQTEALAEIKRSDLYEKNTSDNSGCTSADLLRSSGRNARNGCHGSNGDLCEDLNTAACRNDHSADRAAPNRIGGNIRARAGTR